MIALAQDTIAIASTQLPHLTPPTPDQQLASVLEKSLK